MPQGYPTSIKTIMKVRADYVRGVSQVVLADLYQLSRFTVGRIVAGQYPGLGLSNLSRGRGRPRKRV